jgi:hypothetical protein
MANLVEENLPSENYSGDELRVKATSEFYIAAETASGSIKLGANPSDGSSWRLRSPLIDITLTWKTIVSDSGKQCLIGANTLASHTNAAAWLNSNYYFSKHYVADLDGANDQVIFTARKIGSSYNFESSFFAGSGTTFTQDDGDNGTNNLQIALSIWRKDGNDRVESVTEHIAPVSPDENLVEFFIHEDLHPYTSFVAPGINQTTVTEAASHVFVYDIGVADVFGSPPEPNAIRFEGPFYAIRGGSRFENQNSFGNFFALYMVQELNGILSYYIARKATLEQEIYTYWYNSSVGNNYAVRAIITFKDDSTINGIGQTFSGTGRTVWIIPSGIANTNVAALCSSVERSLSDVRSVIFQLEEEVSGSFVAPLGMVIVQEDVFNQRYFMFESSAGGCEILRFTGETAEGFEISKAEYETLQIPSRYWERRTVKNRVIEAVQFYECSTGLLTEEELYAYIDILFSQEVWELSYEGGRYRFPIKITPGSFVLKTDKKDGNYFYAFSFQYTRAYAEKQMGLMNNFY